MQVEGTLDVTDGGFHATSTPSTSGSSNAGQCAHCAGGNSSSASADLASTSDVDSTSWPTSLDEALPAEWTADELTTVVTAANTLIAAVSIYLALKE